MFCFALYIIYIIVCHSVLFESTPCLSNTRKRQFIKCIKQIMVVNASKFETKSYVMYYLSCHVSNVANVIICACIMNNMYHMLVIPSRDK